MFYGCFYENLSVSTSYTHAGSLVFAQETTSMHAVDHSSLCTKASAVIL